MICKKLLFTALTSSFLFGAANAVSLSSLDGSWILRTMDGHQVSSARAILDFNSKHKKIDGYDGCNRIEGKLALHTNNIYSSKLKTYRYECRNSTKRFVSARLHTAIAEGFTIQKAKMQGEKGILLQSPHHKLFFKKLGGNSITDYFKIP
ncbi:META domain-containing protein [Sulfurovum sp.]|uniref:META domain-containing protein n=1 Tax=Sulfurovum sp. TaxID=1969726 RepID=UPI0025D5C532|nr:META domain-containing protein [Sulfurovum sp.]